MKKLPLKKRYMLEMLGMLLVLFSAGYQVFFSAPSQSQASDEALLNVRQRIDTIWIYIGKYSHLSAESQQDDYDRYQLHNDLTPLYYQFDKQDAWQVIADKDSKIAGLMFTLGSLLLLVSRFLELKHASASSSPEPDGAPAKAKGRKRRH